MNWKRELASLGKIFLSYIRAVIIAELIGIPLLWVLYELGVMK